MSSNKSEFVNLANARNGEQKGVMKEIAKEGHCPFCTENLAKYHKNHIEREGAHWLITKNQWPYDYTEVHLLAILTYHAEDVSGLKPGALDELQSHLEWAVKSYGIAAGGLAMRFGGIDSNGASVRHLHAHIIKPDPSRKKDQKVRFKIS